MIDLKQFCANETDYREYLRNPWRQNGQIAATNGHILIAVADDGRELPEFLGLTRTIGAVAKFLQITADNYTPLSSIVLPPVELCDSCNGTGKEEVPVTKDCSKCNGNGVVECDMGHDHNCPECDGAGEFETGEMTQKACKACDGTGHKYQQPVAVGKAHINRRYLALIASLPSAEIAVPDVDDKPIPFRFAGGQGVIMGLRV